MRKRRNIITGTAVLLARSVVKVVDAGAGVVKSSTQGLQDLYREAKNEYDSERASVRTVGSPIVVPGASPASDSPSIYVPSEPPVSPSGIVSTPLTSEGTTNGGSAETGTGPRKRGRPRKSTLLETAPAQTTESAIIVGTDGKPARKKRAASVKETETSAPKPRGRPRRSADAGTGGNGASTVSAQARGSESLDVSAGPHTLSELDGTTEPPIIPDDLTIPGGTAETPAGLGTDKNQGAFGSAGEAPVE